MIITPGIQSAPPWTADVFHQNVDDATFESDSVADYKTTELPIWVGASRPTTLNGGQIIVDNSINGADNPSYYLLAWNGGEYVPIGNLVYVQNLGSAVAVGDIVRSGSFDSTNEAIYVINSSLAANPFVIGACATAMNTNDFGFVITRGRAYVNVGGTPVVGGALVGSAVNGQATANSRLVTTGCFGRLVDTTNKIALLTGVLKGT